jgi:hypothetical protein
LEAEVGMEVPAPARNWTLVSQPVARHFTEWNKKIIFGEHTSKPYTNTHITAIEFTC